MHRETHKLKYYNRQEISKKIGARLRLIRTHMKLSRESFAQLVDISVDALGLIERGKSLPRLETIYKITTTLNIPLSKILDVNTPLIISNKKKRKLEGLLQYLKNKNIEEIDLVHDVAKKILEEKKHWK